MTSLLVLLAIVQAALLLWAAVQLSSVLLQSNRLRSVLRGLVALGAAIALVRYSSPSDPSRVLCTTGDCLVLVFCLAGVRFVAVNNEAERLLEERRIAGQAAADAMADARRAEEGARVQAATAAIEARPTRLTPWSG